MTAPPNQVCPICAHDDDIETVFVAGEWIRTCKDLSHLPFEWRPTVEQPWLGTYRTGVGIELGVYEDLLLSVVDCWSEYGVIEYRYSKIAPQAYRELVKRYGHTAQGPTKYSASAFLGGALGQLYREELIEGVWGPATGYWSYNSQVGAYAPLGTAESDHILTWEDYAEKTVSADPFDWPPLGYQAPTE